MPHLAAGRAAAARFGFGAWRRGAKLAALRSFLLDGVCCDE
jgi:hypothetical protein